MMGAPRSGGGEDLCAIDSVAKGAFLLALSRLDCIGLAVKLERLGRMGGLPAGRSWR